MDRLVTLTQSATSSSASNNQSQNQADLERPQKGDKEPAKLARKGQFLDPLQSIANVLTEHHNARRRQAEEKLRAKVGAPTEREGDQLEESAPIASAHKAPQAKKAAAAAAAEQEAQTSVAGAQEPADNLKQQVDQGNSYLYAYNEFISSPAKLSKGQALFTGAGESVVSQGASASANASATATASGAVGDRKRPICMSESTPSGQPSGGVATAAAPQEQLRRNDKQQANHRHLHHKHRHSHKRHRENCLRRQAAADDDEQRQRCDNKISGNGGDTCLRDTKANDADACGAISDAAEDQAQDDTLSYILNQRRVSAAPAIGREHVRYLPPGDEGSGAEDEDEDEDEQDTQLAWTARGLASERQRRQQLVAIAQANKQAADNPNHLRQYLQIEENYNCFKAARRRFEWPPAGLVSRQTGKQLSGAELALAAHNAHYYLATQQTSENQDFAQSDADADEEEALRRETNCRLASGNISASVTHHNHHLNQVTAAASLGARRTSSQQVVMYSTSPLAAPGHAGAYYVSPQATAAAAGGHNMHLHDGAGGHLHASHQNTYQISSGDSSLGSSGAFASSSAALRRVTSSWLRHFCSKKCLLVSCLMIILFVFIFVSSLSAYLNFLINMSKTNLQPLSGRLRVDNLLRQSDAADSGGGGGASAAWLAAEAQQLLAASSATATAAATAATNRSAPEFLNKQQQFETILRGAFDRTQQLLKTYPNHLVKLEVYSFRPATPQSDQNNGAPQLPNSVWVYFRLFLNKRTLLQDNLLMKRKSSDEHLEKQFLPRLTQQTLQSGFEQLLATFGGSGGPAEAAAESLLAAESRRFGARQQAPDAAQQASATRGARATSSQQTNVKSFDEQIHRLMHLVEAIDLQSIQVAPEFDMLQSQLSAGQAAPPTLATVMSDNLRVPQPISVQTTTNLPPQIVLAPGGNASQAADLARRRASDLQQATSATTPTTTTTPTTSTTTQASATKFTLNNYKENSTRPSKPAPPPSARPASAESPFLVNLQQRKPTTLSSAPTAKPPASRQLVTAPAAPSNTLRELSQAARNEKPVVRLVSGQPVQLQAGGSSAPAAGQSKPLFAPLPRLATTAPTSPAAPPAPTAGTRPTTAAPTTTPKPAPAATSIEELWNNAINGGNQRQKAASRLQQPQRPHDAPGRLITAATIGPSEGSPRLKPQQQAPPARPAPSGQNSPVAQSSGGGAIGELSSPQRPGEFSSDSSNTIRAQLNASLASQSAPTGPIVQLGANSNLAKQSRVSPHLQLAGSLISTQQQQPPSSAVVLSRDISAGGASATSVNSSNLNNSPLQTPPPPPQVSLSTSTSVGGSSTAASVPKPKKNGSARAAGGQQRPQPASTLAPKPNIRQQPPPPSKPKKLVATSGAAKNVTNEVSSATTTAPPSSTAAAKPATRARVVVVGSSPAAPTQSSFAPTQPTTIELTRATAAFRPSSSTTTTAASTLSSSSPPVAEPTETTTQLPPPETDSAVSFVLADQQARPGTTSFSGQWRPLATGANSSSHSQEANPIQLQRPRGSLAGPTRGPSLIISTERLPLQLVPSSLAGGGGSQSPFAMPAAMQLDAVQSGGQQQARQHFSNRFSRPIGPMGAQRFSSSSSSDFESHRVSRMRNSATSNAAGGGGLSSENFSAATTLSSLSSTSGESGSTAKIVDDFVITTDSGEPTRSSTLLPPLVFSSVGGPPAQPVGASRPQAHLLAVESPIESPTIVFQTSKRTRGPFAFETLRSLGEQTELPAGGAFRSERSFESQQRANNRQQTNGGGDDKLLVRKRLFVSDDSDAAEDLSVSPSTSPSVVVALQDELDGDRTSNGADDELAEISPSFGDRTAGRRAPAALEATAAGAASGAQRCQFHGCKLRGSPTIEFACLNSTQICDDFIDCQDESDELDCVSLLKTPESSAQQTPKRLSFSNGAGVIHLNRRGALAPLCIDYKPVAEEGAGDERQSFLSRQNSNSDKRQQELIRQINTIGQYACSLQSFSRLVSVKINHHDLVDGLNLIKSSRLYHTLSIVSSSGSGASEQSSQSDLYKSGNSEHEVEVSTSARCPSQRTVFVKCGGFQCGQDSFNLNSRNPSRQVRNRTGAVDFGDFPWLVKLYRSNSLACHGYLIDESWLVTSSECFAGQRAGAHNGTASDDAFEGGGGFHRQDNGIWSAEISYEHYGDGDELRDATNSNRRSRIVSILTKQADELQQDSSPIVLAKLEKSVRFSPLNRPICLPLKNRTSQQQEQVLDLEFDKTYKDCVAVTLQPPPPPPSNANTSTQLPPTQNLLLNRVKLSKAENCLSSDDVVGANDEQSAATRARLSTRNNKDLICAEDETATTRRAANEERHEQNSWRRRQQLPATSVLICSSAEPGRLRSRWTVVGVQNKAPALKLRTNKWLFTTVSSQIDWIVDTMNPKSLNSNADDASASSSADANSAGGFVVDANGNSLLLAGEDGLNPLRTGGAARAMQQPHQQLNQTCNRFKCSSGECLSWSRICDGLYDCSSHDDEKDCHK